jgi:hypothetical protein
VNNWNTLVVGLIVLEAAFAIGARQILLGPNAVNYPSAEPVTRCVMFVWSATLMLRGSDLVLSWFMGRPEPLAAIAFPPAFMLALVQTVMLRDILRHRLPARMWARIHRAVDIATCASGWDRLTDWVLGRETFETARRRAAIRSGVQPIVSTNEAAVLMGEAVLRGEQVVGPRERPGRAK